jgi:iron(III) transport system substrate-binding protein
VEQKGRIDAGGKVTFFPVPRGRERQPLARMLRQSLLLSAVFLLTACQRQNTGKEVVLYSSIDETYARQIATMFENRTAIHVKLVSDAEETKSTGLINRLIAEESHPVADVFWSGDVVRAAMLKGHGIAESYVPSGSQTLPRECSDPDGYYVGFSARLRLIIYNKDRVGPEKILPQSVLDLAKPEFAAGSCLANPLFGTTSMHAAALFETLGDEVASQFFQAFRANGGRMLSSNGEVRRRVGSGEFAFGLTDSDDVNVALIDRKPVGYVIPDQEGSGVVLVPSSAVLIKNAPHPANAKLLVDFLVSETVEQLMAESSGAHFPLRSNLAAPAAFGVRVQDLKILPLDYGRVAVRLESLQNGFLRTWVEALR